jgi:hypothetical protein
MRTFSYILPIQIKRLLGKVTRTTRLSPPYKKQGCFVLCRGNPPVVAPLPNPPNSSWVEGAGTGARPYKILIFLRMKQPCLEQGGGARLHPL